MNESEYLELREIAWRRPLTADERSSLQGYLLVHPDAHIEWEEDAALNQLLANVPDAPLSSNFTARVLQAIDLEELREERKQRAESWLSRLRSWLPRFAVAGLVAGLGGLGYQQYQIHSQEQKAKYLDTLVAGVASSFPDTKIWEDFDAIAKLQPAVVSASDDRMLWAALTEQ
jgi:hypothetical protein